jgi:hypothetical protein
MTQEALKTLTDDDLRAVIAHANNLLKERDRERKESALEQAKAILAQAGLSLKGLAKTKPKRVHENLRAGMRFFNIENPDQIYEVGKGRPPGWFEKGRAKGMLPLPEGANDNTPTPANDNRAKEVKQAAPGASIR